MPEVLRPLYESSTVLAQKTTMTVRLAFYFLLCCKLWFLYHCLGCIESLWKFCYLLEKYAIVKYKRWLDFIFQIVCYPHPGSTPAEADSSWGFSINRDRLGQAACSSSSTEPEAEQVNMLCSNLTWCLDFVNVLCCSEYDKCFLQGF